MLTASRLTAAPHWLMISRSGDVSQQALAFSPVMGK
jgi:hypothetical protein